MFGCEIRAELRGAKFGSGLRGPWGAAGEQRSSGQDSGRWHEITHFMPCGLQGNP